MSATAKKLTDVSDEDDFSFYVFGSDGEQVDLGIGKPVSGSFSYKAPPKEVDQPSPNPEEPFHPTTQPEEVEAEPVMPELSPIPEPSVEPVALEDTAPEEGVPLPNDPIPITFSSHEIEASTDVVPEEQGSNIIDSIRRYQDQFNELMTDMKDRPTISSHLEIHEEPKSSSSTDVYVFEDVDTDNFPLIDNIEVLQQQYIEATTPVKLVDKTTTADRVGRVLKYLSENFIMKPISWIFKKLHSGVRELIVFFLKVSLFLLMVLILSVIATTYANHLNKSEPYTLPELVNAYETIKGIVFRAFHDLPGAISMVKGLFIGVTQSNP